MKLHQIVALLAGKKSQTQKKLTELYRKVQTPKLYSGISRIYKPFDEEGERLPTEANGIQFTTGEAIEGYRAIVGPLMDLVASQDQGNMVATADIKVKSGLLAVGLPVPTLLYLEKQLVDLRTFVTNFPELDPAENWTYSAERGGYVSDPSVTNRTKKVMRNHVKAEATVQHPAQVETYTEDVAVGTWTTLKYSNAVSAVQKDKMLDRINELIDAVKIAREEANAIEVQPVKIAESLLDFVFAEDN